MPREDDGDDERAPLPRVRGDVAFENVSFEYVPGAPVLRDVSFHAPAGNDDRDRRTERGREEDDARAAHGVPPSDAGRVTIDGRDLAAVRLRD